MVRAVAIAFLLLTSCQAKEQSRTEWASCPTPGQASMTAAATMNLAQICMDSAGARMSKAQDNAAAVARAAAIECTAAREEITKDMKDPIAADQLLRTLTKTLEERTEAFIVQIRAFDCMDSPTFQLSISKP